MLKILDFMLVKAVKQIFFFILQMRVFSLESDGLIKFELKKTYKILFFVQSSNLKI